MRVSHMLPTGSVVSSDRLRGLMGEHTLAFSNFNLPQ